MDNGFNNIDLRAIFESVKQSLNQFGGFNPTAAAKSGMGAERLRHEILASVAEGAKTGFEIQTHIAASHTKPSSSQLYPLLEQLTDEGVLTSAVKKDRRVFAITDAGKTELAAWNKDTQETNNDAAALNAWSLPQWVDLKGELPKSVLRLSKVAVEVGQHGTKEQQDAAAKVIAEATKKLHGILAAE